MSRRLRPQGLAVLRWNRIACGAAAFINGQKVGENEPTGPFQVIVPAGVLRPGDNQIVLKIRGAAGVPKSRSGHALIPAGFGVGMPEVTDDIWIDFADTAYMKWVLALPDLAGGRVKIRVTPTGSERLDDLKIVAQVKSWPDGKVMGEGQAPARLTPSPDPLGGEHFFVEVPMPGFQPWTYEEPHLYTAEVTLSRGTKVLDAATIRFGMREITTAGGHYLLNGKTLRLRGSELVFEWNWGDTITGKEFDYLVTEAREMSMNAFRTHTMPLPPLWADICDENGTMILAEFPCLYNYQDYKFTPEEYAIWHQNVLSDAAGWMGRLWNHPAVVMWVLSNESNRDSQWETGPYHDFVRALDPTRPTMRTGDTGTAENYDVHTCGNIDRPAGRRVSSRDSLLVSRSKGPARHQQRVHELLRPAGDPVDGQGGQGRRCAGLRPARHGAHRGDAPRPPRWHVALHVRRLDADSARRTRQRDRQGQCRLEGRLCFALVRVLAQLAVAGARQPRSVRPRLPDGPGGAHRPVPHQRLLARCHDPRRSAPDRGVSRVHPGSRVFRPARGEVELRFHAEGRHADEDPHHLEAARAGRQLLAHGSYHRPSRPGGAQPAVRANGAPAGSACGSPRPPLRGSRRRCGRRRLVPVARACRSSTISATLAPGRDVVVIWYADSRDRAARSDRRISCAISRAGGRSRGRAGHPRLGLDRVVRQ